MTVPHWLSLTCHHRNGLSHGKRPGTRLSSNGLLHWGPLSMVQPLVNAQNSDYTKFHPIKRRYERNWAFADGEA